MAFDLDYGPRTDHPLDPRNDGERDLQPCPECGGKNLDCIACDGKGHVFDGEPMSLAEFAAFERDMQAEAQS
jgi:hypothetical protein